MLEPDDPRASAERSEEHLGAPPATTSQQYSFTQTSLAALLVISLYTLIGIAVTWPATRHLSSRLLGDGLDSVQTLWGFWWLRNARELGGTLFYCPALWWPEGVSLWFQTWDLPSAAVALAVWRWVPPLALYNVLVLLTFSMSGFALYLLGRELFGGRMAPFLAGCIYTFSTFHLAHSQAQLHLASMQWSPLFVLGLARAFRTGKAVDAALAGTSLGMAALASVYHLVFCLVVTAILAATCAFRPAGSFGWRGVARVSALSSLAFMLVAGWSVGGMLIAYLTEPYVGGHNPVRFSADLQSFFLPNAVSLWSGMSTSWMQWSGNDWESAAYAGYSVLFLALFAVRGSPTARRYLWVALAGALLALGPMLHVGGQVIGEPALPMAWLQRLLPVVNFSGLPTRYSWLTTFGLSIAACATLHRLCARGRVGVAIAAILTAVSMAETWPHEVRMSSWPHPPIFERWSRERERWAVLDATRGARPLWHQMTHGHPIIAGYVTRTPGRLWTTLMRDEVLTSFLGPPLGDYRQPFVNPADARRRLRSLQVRFVIVEQERAYSAERFELDRLERAYDLVIYEVPAG